jgi:thymidylate synthase
MSMSATAHASSAKDHAIDAAGQLKHISDQLKETMSYLIGTDEDAIRLAAVHLFSIQKEVGSTTAGELGQAFTRVGEDIRSESLDQLSQMIEKLDQYVTRIISLRNNVEQLAAQMGV